MKPVNNKSLLHFLYDNMEKVASGAITVDQGNSIANIARQANQCMKHELLRAMTNMQLDDHQRNGGAKMTLRDIEAKAFDTVTSLE